MTNMRPKTYFLRPDVAIPLGFALLREIWQQKVGWKCLRACLLRAGVRACTLAACCVLLACLLACHHYAWVGSASSLDLPKAMHVLPLPGTPIDCSLLSTCTLPRCSSGLTTTSCLPRPSEPAMAASPQQLLPAAAATSKAPCSKGCTQPEAPLSRAPPTQEPAAKTCPQRS